MRKPIFVLVAIFVAACGELRWSKPGADAGTLARDQTGCRALARESIAVKYGPPVPGPGDVRFGPETSLPGPADRQMLEQQALDRCMREKGYSLVPADK